MTVNADGKLAKPLEVPKAIKIGSRKANSEPKNRPVLSQITVDDNKNKIKKAINTIGTNGRLINIEEIENSALKILFAIDLRPRIVLNHIH